MDRVIIELDKRWELKDFAVLTKEYLQLYGIFYTLSMDDLRDRYDEETGEGVYLGYSTMPWEGGHSVVNFIRSVSSSVPDEHRPLVKQIKYASPGFIELSGVIEVAWQIAHLVSAISFSILASNKVYDKVMRDYRRREWSKLKSEQLRLKNKQLEIQCIEEACILLKATMNFSDEQFDKLLSLAGSDELVQLKMLLAIYRRALPLAELQDESKANFETIEKPKKRSKKIKNSGN